MMVSDSIHSVDHCGTLLWRNRKGQLHRCDGPAVINLNGDHFWYLNGVFHRADGPAIVRARGGKEYYLHGKRVRRSKVMGHARWLVWLGLFEW